jgi:hypothetical protein
MKGAAPGLAAFTLVAVLLLSPLGAEAHAAVATQPPTGDPTPLLAYYYIWFDPGSWDRAKRDLPLLGRYSSDDPEIMRQHVRWAKAVGIDGFIVSWKSTEQLDRRLASLVEVAEAEAFQLAIIYQGLDFERRPLPVDQIASDLERFTERYGDHPVFQLYGRPLVIWSGTWEFSPGEVDTVSQTRRESFFLLASERQVGDYEAIAKLVDGNAYYWSSADPLETPGYQEKLRDMGEAVHGQGGLWIAPAAAGFDARLIGGSRIVERRGGDTLRQALSSARDSSPDAIGLISWNEFSENSHVEPSANFGGQALEALADIRGGEVPTFPDFDSDAPAESLPPPNLSRLAPLAFLALILGGSSALIILRRTKEH